MANVAVYFDNVTDAAPVTLGGGSWLTALPLSNLKDRRLGKVARSTDLLTSSTKFSVTTATLPGYRKRVKCVAVAYHNCFVDTDNIGYGIYQIRAWNSSSKTVLYFDSGTRRVWPFNMPILPTEGFIPLVVEFPELNHELAGYWEIEFTSLSTAGGAPTSLDIGRLMLFSQVFSPAYNALRPPGLKYISRVRTDESLGATRYFTKFAGKPKQRRFRWEWLTAADREKLLDLQRVADIDGEVMLSTDKSLWSLTYPQWMYEIWPARIVDLQAAEVIEDKPTYSSTEMQFLEIIG